MRIITWNINSIRLRLPLLKKIKEELNPDIICLQETKVHNDLFPASDLKAIGYEYQYFHGEKAYNGMAVLSNIPLTQKDQLYFGGKNDTRHQSLILPGDTILHNFYVPAGGDEPDPIANPKFAFKLKFLDEMVNYFKNPSYKGQKQIIVGDLNTAPLETDVWSHKQLLKVISHTPIEVEKMERLRDSLNWVDVSRHFTGDKIKLYSWWSYRNQDWRKSDRGRRLDHIWVTKELQESLLSTQIIKDARDWEVPSDHVPVVMDLKI